MGEVKKETVSEQVQEAKEEVVAIEDATVENTEASEA